MNAQSVMEESRMDDNGRIIRLETEMGRVHSGIHEIKVSVEGVKTELHAFREDVAREFGLVRSGMAKEVASLRVDMEKGLGGGRSDTEKGFGSLRTEMAMQSGALKTSIERYTRWIITAGLSVMATLITMLATVAHALKWF